MKNLRLLNKDNEIYVKYNMKIKAKGDKKPCLFLPIYRGIREDVEIADNFDKLK